MLEPILPRELGWTWSSSDRKWRIGGESRLATPRLPEGVGRLKDGRTVGSRSESSGDGSPYGVVQFVKVEETSGCQAAGVPAVSGVASGGWLVQAASCSIRQLGDRMLMDSSVVTKMHAVLRGYFDEF